jgi:hypothetical protein
MLLMNLKTGRLANGHNVVEDGHWVPVAEAEPFFTQEVVSKASPVERTSDGKFDRSHLSPEHAYRIGRDYLAHCIRYGWPMKVIKERFGVGARILELGCGKELPMFRTLTCDHSATTHYKPSRYVGIDLNRVKYNPNVNGIRTTILSEVNVVTQPEKIPDEVFDLVASFEVVEHMGKDDGTRFLDAIISSARRKILREDKVGVALISTPVNGGTIAKNHIYEWQRGELRRAIEALGGTVVGEHGTFSNIKELVNVLTPVERQLWNSLADYHTPHVLSCLFSANHPEAARNVAWLVEVRS